jgi:DNA-binding response OmpR family regulator/chromosome segregation ATPase
MQLAMPKVLIFESDPVFASELRSGLEQHACAVTVVGDATEGLQVAASERPDLVLLTVELPRINGFSVCNKLKRDPGLKSVPLIIMSSDSNEDTFSQHRRLKHSRAEDYVHKPISFVELLPRIKNLVELPESNGHSDEVVRIAEEEPTRMDSYLEIDEELEELDSEDTELNAEFDGDLQDNELQDVESAPAEANVDAEVDEFTEHAFDALLDEDTLTTQAEDDPDTKVDATRSVFPPSGTPVPPTSVNPIPLASELPRSRAPRNTSVVPVEVNPRLSESEALAAIDPALMAEKDQAIAELEGLLAQANSLLEEHKAGAERKSLEAEQLRRELLAEAERRGQDADQLRRELAAQLEQHRGELSSLRREMEQTLRERDGARSGSQPPPGQGTAQDFLSLREALNRKDKEILDLHGQLSTKSKELLGVKDASLVHEREKTESVDRALAAERELHELNRVHNAVKADKDQAAKRADDFKRRAEKLAGELQEREHSLGELRRELEASEARGRAGVGEAVQRGEERLAALEAQRRAEADEARAQIEASERQRRAESDEARARTESAEETRQREIAEAEARLRDAEDTHQRALSDAQREAEQRLAGAEEQRQRALAEAKERSDAELARAEHLRQRALAEAAEQAEARLARAVDATRSDAERRLTEAVEHERLTSERSKMAALEHQEARLKTEYEQAFAMLAEEKATAYAALERDRDTAIARAEQEIAAARATSRDLSKDLEEAGREIEKLEQALTQTRAELEHERSQHESTRSDLAQLVSQLEGTKRDLAHARNDLTTLGKELEALQQELGATRSELTATRTDLASTLSDLAGARGRAERLDSELNDTTAELSTARADLAQLQQDFSRVHATATAALSKWEQDRHALHKGREALEAALEQLTQIESRPLN